MYCDINTCVCRDRRRSGAIGFWYEKRACVGHVYVEEVVRVMLRICLFFSDFFPSRKWHLKKNLEKSQKVNNNRKKYLKNSRAVENNGELTGIALQSPEKIL